MDMSTRLETVIKRIDALLAQKAFVIVAIDGKCTSGKTTLAAQLEEVYDCNVFHMDDFFLRPEQRTKERFAQPGGNIDKERFLDEVLLPLSRGEHVNYRRFDCSTFTLTEPVSVTQKRLTIIEGAYSMHPELAKYYDISVFLNISADLQKKRIEHRNSPQMAVRFFNEWIPMEIKYFEAFNIKDQCDIVIDITK
jgi:uridine kinase